jgi:hypothetical protein
MACSEDSFTLLTEIPRLDLTLAGEIALHEEIESKLPNMSHCQLI